MRLRRLAPAIAAFGAFCSVAGVVPAFGATEDESAKPSLAIRAADEADPERFLDDVSLLITDDEREAFASLTRSYQQRAFIRRFWQVRDPYPQTARNELAERWYERLQLARDRYRDFSDDRARILLWNGDPERIVRLRCGEHLRVGEIWVYRQSNVIPAGFVLAFLSNGVSTEAPHRLWSGRIGVRELFAWQGNDAGKSDAELLAEVQEGCPRGSEILDLLFSASEWDALAERFHVIPQPNPEWVRTFQAHSTDVPADAGELVARVDIRFSGRHQSRTIVDAAVLLEANDLPAAVDLRRSDLVLDGEVLRGDELFEQFRYRFDRPPPSATGPLSFPARRYLRAGNYHLVLRLLDSSTGRYFRSEEELVVPAPGEADPLATAAAMAAPVSPARVAPTAQAGLAAATETVEPSLRLLAPIDRLVTGRTRIEADVRGFDAARVEFALDGQLLLSRRRGPFTVDLDLGTVPRLRRVTARGFDAAGAVIAEDEIVMNGGPHRFAVRLVEPEKLPRPGEPMTAKARVDLPEGEELDRLEFYLDGARLATLFQPPYTIPVAAGVGRLSYLRAVAYLRDGTAAEDVRLLAGGDLGSTVEVDFVELYTTILDRRGRPIDDLLPTEVEVREDGVAQLVEKFERVDSAPIHAGVMIDTSASMIEELRDAESAAEKFFREILTERDRAAVITFADAPRLAARFTGDVGLLAGGLANLEAVGETRLYDALAYALHYFSGIRGKRALIILSDFADSGSKYKMDEIVEYARRTGVTIYGIGLAVPRGFPEASLMLDRLTRETGGRAYRISRVAELNSIYESIRTELRAQYLIAYQSSRTDGSSQYREIEVKLSRPGADARTLRGYYP